MKGNAGEQDVYKGEQDMHIRTLQGNMEGFCRRSIHKTVRDYMRTYTDINRKAGEH